MVSFPASCQESTPHLQLLWFVPTFHYLEWTSSAVFGLKHTLVLNCMVEAVGYQVYRQQSCASMDT